MNNNIKSITSIIHLILSLTFVLFLPISILVKIVPYLFLAQIVSFIIDARRLSVGNVFYFSPAFLCLFYTIISFSLGSYAVSLDYVPDQWTSLMYNAQHKLKIVTFIIILSSYVVFLSSIVCYVKFYFHNNEYFEQTNFDIKLPIILLIVFSIVPVNLSFIGGAGNYSIIPMTMGASYLINILAKKKYKNRWWYYLLILVLFSVLRWGNKREAILLFVPIIFLESIYNNIVIDKIRFKNILIGSMTVAMGLYLIIVMSIIRGYGNFETKNFFKAMTYVDDYMAKDDFYTNFFVNIEVSTAYVHSYTGIAYVLDDLDLLSYGSTFYKIIFIPIPRSMYPGKPSSMIDLFTSVHSPWFRSVGGSFPVNIYTEAFWNFYYFGFLFLFFLFYFFNKYYYNCVNEIESGLGFKKGVFLFFISQWIAFCRGNGFDVLIVTLIIAKGIQILFNQFTSDFSVPIMNRNIYHNRVPRFNRRMNYQL